MISSFAMATLTRARTEDPPLEASEQHVDGTVPSPFPVHFLSGERSNPAGPSILATGEAHTGRPLNFELDGSKLEAVRKTHTDARKAGRDDAVAMSLKDIRQSCVVILAQLVDQDALHVGQHDDHAKDSSPPSNAASLRSILSCLSQSSSLAFSLPQSDLPRYIVDNIQKQERLGAMDLPHGTLASSLALLSGYLDKLLELLPFDSLSLLTPHPAQSEVRNRDMYGSLDRTLRALNSLGMQLEASKAFTPTQMEQTSLWRSIEACAEEIAEVLNQGELDAQSLPSLLDWDHPPRYEMEPPGYAPHSAEHKTPLRHAHTSPDLHRLSASSSISGRDSKMKMELEALTRAIDRLNSMVPQILSQRVELRPAKQEELEFARLFGDLNRMTERRLNHQRVGINVPKVASPLYSTKGKGHAVEPLDELDHLMDLIGRSHDMRILNQCVSPSDEVLDLWGSGNLNAVRPRESLQVSWLCCSDEVLLISFLARTSRRSRHEVRESRAIAFPGCVLLYKECASCVSRLLN